MPKFRMRLLTLTILLFLTTISRGQTELGTGLIAINISNSTHLQFYNSQTDKQPVKTIEFFDDKTISSRNIRDLDKQKQWLKPECIWLDYYSFLFRCKSQTSDRYEVIVNNETGKSYWIDKNTLTTYKTWEMFLKGMFGISRLYPQKIKEQPTDNSKEIQYLENDCFKAKSMKGDWIEIYTSDDCDNKTRINSGWIKWKKGNVLLIEYFITS